MSFPYDPTIPNPPNDPADDVSVMQTNAGSISTLIAVDHSGFNVSTGGTHKQVTFSSNNTPTLPLTFPTAFTQDPSTFTGGAPTDAQFFFYPENADATTGTNQYILTGNGSTYLTGGIIIKWGTKAANATSTAVTFASAFPNNCFVVNVTPLSAAAGLVPGNYPGATSLSTSGFTLTKNTAGALTYQYVAIGN